MGNKAREILVTVLVILCLGLVLADSSHWFLRLDLTRSRAFSISPVSRSIISDIPEQVHITYYLSDSLKSLAPASGRIVDLLQEYAAESRGKVLVTVVDPDAAGRAESARSYGILPQQIQVIQQNEQRTINVYSGIAVDYLDRFTSLPAVFTSDGLEYSLGLSIRKLLAGRRIVVGVEIGAPGKTLQSDYDTLQTGLSRDYSLHEYLPGDAIPPEVDVLLVIGGTHWSADQVRPIDAYVMNGGKVLFATKSLDVDTARTFTASPVAGSALLDMIAAYGVRVNPGMVMDTASRDYRLPQQKPSGEIAWEKIARYPPWVSVQGPGVSTTNPITASFTGLDLLWPAPLSAVERPGVRSEMLVQSSPSSWLQEAPFVIDPYRVPQSGGPASRYTLAYALSGTFPGAFAGGNTHSKPTRMLVVGDGDFASDLMHFSDSLANVLFMENSILWLSGNADLLSIKTRAATEGRLDRIQDPVTRSRIMVAAPIVNVVVIPVLVLAVGVVRSLRRRERRGP
jgi:ABC-type uncharacterized transport system involved in gliding motility auxiliary subunit